MINHEVKLLVGRCDIPLGRSLEVAQFGLDLFQFCKLGQADGLRGDLRRLAFQQ